jgi:hypothetical protein
MKPIRVAVMAAAALCVCPVLAHAVSQDNFPPKTMGDLVAICSAARTDPMATAALNFCHGYFRGAIDLQDDYAAASHRPVRFYCLPMPHPSFDESQARLAEWAAAHQDQMSAKPVDGLFRFLGDTYPCPPGQQRTPPQKK